MSKESREKTEEIIDFLKNQISEDIPKEGKKEALKGIEKFKKEMADYEETTKLAESIAKVINKSKNKEFVFDLFLTILRRRVKVVIKDKIAIFMMQILEEYSNTGKLTDIMLKAYTKQKEPESKFVG